MLERAQNNCLGKIRRKPVCGTVERNRISEWERWASWIERRVCVYYDKDNRWWSFVVLFGCGERMNERERVEGDGDFHFKAGRGHSAD